MGAAKEHRKWTFSFCAGGKTATLTALVFREDGSKRPRRLKIKTETATKESMDLLLAFLGMRRKGSWRKWCESYEGDPFWACDVEQNIASNTSGRLTWKQ